VENSWKSGRKPGGRLYGVLGVRGATSIERDDPDHVRQRVVELVEEIFKKNRIDRIISVIFSVTPDVKSMNPATVFRLEFNFPNVPLMCLQEAVFDDSPGGIIRVLIIFEGEGGNFVYLHKARELRRDITWDSRSS